MAARPSATGSDGVGRDVRPSGEVLLDLLAGRLQHEVGGVLPAGRSPDAHADAEELRRAQGALQGLQPVVTARAAAELDPKGAGGDVEFVVDRDQVLGLDVLLLGHAGDTRVPTRS